MIHQPSIVCFLIVAAGLVSLAPCSSAATGSLPYQEGVQAFEQHRWREAMDQFLTVLKQDPKNPKAHAYINLIARQLELEKNSTVREKRLELLAKASKQLEANHKDSTPIDNAILDTTQAEERARQERWRTQCEQARIERDLGHLLSANDLVLQVLAENASYPEAQRELSELQSRLRDVLDHSATLSMEERYAHEGFYAFGQSDYAAALTAWQKVHALVGSTYSMVEGAQRIRSLRFSAHEKVAQSHVDQEKRIAELKDLFQEARSLYERHRYEEALDAFRRLAIREPEYPQLGTYIIQAESAAEKARVRRLGEEKRAQVARLIQEGVSHVEHERYRQAKDVFEKALQLDPSNSQARTYLAMAEAEMLRRHDPKAAQLHYETGLIAYASGRLDEAVREWRLASRLNPEHEKAQRALAKVQRELALSRNAP